MIFSKTYPSFLTVKEGFFRKPTRPSLPLRKAPPLTPALSPQERGRKPPSGARNRYAIRLADHQRSRQVVRDWTAWLKWRPHGWAWFAIMDLWNTDFEGKEPLVEDLKNQCHWECVYFVGR